MVWNVYPRDLMAELERLQRGYPQSLDHIASIRGSGRSRYPALNVGGDYIACLPCGENQIAFVVADVAGKGMTAALVMAVGALIGGWLGGKLAGKIKPSTLRWTVVTIGVIVAIIYFVR